ncbi:arabinose ABC transporter substrate-binding protein [Candidatus Sumerlaeota bacterium]|nr:arabinose ABC transporter substrate-binding protein [Candidatus Sumerlaeota bacterium]
MNLLKNLVFVMFIVLLAGCGEEAGVSSSPTPKEGEKITIGFIVKQPEEPWFQMEHRFAREASKEHGFELMELAGTDSEKVLSLIDNLGVKGAKGLLICTPDVKLGPAIMSRAEKYGLKVIAVDDRFIGNDGKFMENVHYLGIAGKEIGKDVGAELYKEMQKRGWDVKDTGVAMITFHELDTAKDRTDGAAEALIAAGFPKEQIYLAPQKTSDIKGSLEATDILLVQKPGVKHWLVAGMNDSAVLGAIRSMEARGFSPKDVCGIGINGTDCIGELEKREATGFYGSMLLQAKKHGYDTATMMYRWIKEGVEPPLDTRTRGILITRDNFREILREQGFEGI